MLNIFKKKPRVIVDTNALLLPGQGTDIFSAIDEVMDSYELFIIKGTVDELQKLMIVGKGSEKFNAKLGYILINQKKARQLDNKGATVDDSIVAYTNDNTYVLTLDKKLKERIKEKNGRLLHLKGKRLTL
jgi:rRNA-processing protein FCF1